MSLLAVYARRFDVLAWLSTMFTMGKLCLLGASTVLVVLGVGGRATKRFQGR